MVAVTLRYLAYGPRFHELKSLFGIGSSTGHKYVKQVIRALCAIGKRHIYWPHTIEQYSEIIVGFESHRGMPNVIGAIDGTHVAIAEVQSEIFRSLDWLNRKKMYSMHTQAVCDHRM